MQRGFRSLPSPCALLLAGVARRAGADSRCSALSLRVLARAQPHCTARPLIALRAGCGLTPQRRCAASSDRSQSRAPSGDPTQVQRLVAAKGTDAGRLAGAICNSIRRSGGALVVAMGPSAVHQALRSICIAGEFMRKERPGEDVGAIVTQDAVGDDGNDIEMRLLVGCHPGGAEGVKELDVLVAQATNVGKVASFVAKAMDEEAKAPILRGMGHQAISQALKASIVARKFMKFEAGEELIVVPRIIKTYLEKDAGKKRVEMVLACRRSKHSRGAGVDVKAKAAAPAKAPHIVKV